MEERTNEHEIFAERTEGPHPDGIVTSVGRKSEMRIGARRLRRLRRLNARHSEHVSTLRNLSPVER